MLWQLLSVPPTADPPASNVHNLRQSVPRYNHIPTFFVLSLFFFAHTSITCMSAIRFSDCLFTNASKNRLQQMLQPVNSLFCPQKISLFIRQHCQPCLRVLQSLSPGYHSEPAHSVQTHRRNLHFHRSWNEELWNIHKSQEAEHLPQ